MPHLHKFGSKIIHIILYAAESMDVATTNKYNFHKNQESF